jgi:membrane protein YqaA with SNARE-associated domain
MEELLTTHGYPALFLLSFLASTLLPLGSEWLLAALLLKGFDPTLSVAVATLGNTLGALTTYGIGFWGGPVLIGRVLRIDEAARRRAERFYARYGVWSLLLSWVPVLGDPLCLVGGLLRVGFGRFFLLVAAGKLARYVGVALLTLEGSRLLA